MSLGGKPSSPKLPEPKQIEEVQKVEDDASEEQKREKRRISMSEGKQSTLIAGIQNALKSRLGE